MAKTRGRCSCVSKILTCVSGNRGWWSSISSHKVRGWGGLGDDDRGKGEVGVPQFMACMDKVLTLTGKGCSAAIKQIFSSELGINHGASPDSSIDQRCLEQSVTDGRTEGIQPEHIQDQRETRP